MILTQDQAEEHRHPLAILVDEQADLKTKEGESITETSSQSQEPSDQAAPTEASAEDLTGAEFKEEAEGKAKLSPTFEAYLKQYATGLVEQDKEQLTYIQYLQKEINKLTEGAPISETTLMSFSNYPLIQAPGRPAYFPPELYPNDSVFIGVGNREQRYKTQLTNILNHEKLVGLLAYIAMRKFFYTGGSMNIRPLKNKYANRALNFVPILDNFINSHMPILLHVADQIFGPEMASIRIQQKHLVDAEVERQQKLAESLKKEVVIQDTVPANDTSDLVEVK